MSCAGTPVAPRAACVRRTAPSANLRSGSAVRTSTVTSPRMPWGRPMRPTTTSKRSALADVEEVDADGLARGDRLEHGAQRGGRATGLADHATHVVGVDPDLE